MMFIFVFLLILAISFLLAWRSMREFYPPEEIKEIFKTNQLLGRIIFFKKGIRHYSSSSSSISSRPKGGK